MKMTYRHASLLGLLVSLWCFDYLFGQRPGVSRNIPTIAKSPMRAPRVGQNIVVPPTCSASSLTDCCCAIINAINNCCNTILATTCGPVTQIHQSNIPYTIVTPGRYCIVEDLTSSADAITVLARGVDIDAHFHTITLTDPHAIGILVEQTSDVSVHGGFIRGGNGHGAVGIMLDTSNNISINNMSLEGTTTGILTFTCSGIVVENCTCENNVTGIQFGQTFTLTSELENTTATIGHECIAQNCIITNFTAQGIALNQLSNSFVQDVILRGSTEQAQHILINYCDHCCVVGAKTESLGAIGIAVTAGQAIKIADCFIFLEQNSAIGISLVPGLDVFFDNDGGASDVLIYQVGGIVIQDTIVSGSFTEGIHANGCYKLTLDGLQIFGNGNIGINLTKACYDVQILNSAITLQFAESGISVNNSNTIAIENSTITLVSSIAEANGVEILNTTHMVIKNSIITLNVPTTDLPGGDGIVLLGGVKNCIVQDCVIDNYPQVGILSLNPDLYGPTFDIVVNNCVIHNALDDGITFSAVVGGTIQNCDLAFTNSNAIELIGCTNIAVLNNVIQNNGNIGIVLDAFTNNCPVRDNTISGNVLNGLTNINASNAIYHNFANANGVSAADNYVGVPLVVTPGPGIGALENISQ